VIKKRVTRKKPVKRKKPMATRTTKKRNPLGSGNWVIEFVNKRTYEHGWYTGYSIDDDLRQAKHFISEDVARIRAIELITHFKFYWVPVLMPLIYYKKKAASKKRNPVPPSKRVKIKEAARRFADFTGHEAESLTLIDNPNNDTTFLIGDLDGVLYTTVRDGQKESYVHEFKTRSRPLLASSYDGKQLYILNGGYKMTDRGIVG
jgi:hypothetical protein